MSVTSPTIVACDPPLLWGLMVTPRWSWTSLAADSFNCWDRTMRAKSVGATKGPSAAHASSVSGVARRHNGTS